MNLKFRCFSNESFDTCIWFLKRAVWCFHENRKIILFRIIDCILEYYSCLQLLQNTFHESVKRLWYEIMKNVFMKFQLGDVWRKWYEMSRKIKGLDQEWALFNSVQIKSNYLYFVISLSLLFLFVLLVFGQLETCSMHL